MEHSEKLALFNRYGIYENIENACNNEQLLYLLSNDEPMALKKAAIILFELLIIENNSIAVLKKNPELQPLINLYYHQDQNDKIIRAFLIPVNLEKVLNSLKKAHCSDYIFLLNRNRSILKALTTSPSVNYTTALLLLFKRNNKISQSEVAKLNENRAMALNFLRFYRKEDLYNFAMQDNNALIFNKIDVLICSKLLFENNKVIIEQLEFLIANPRCCNLIIAASIPQEIAIVCHLFINGLTLKKLNINNLFSSVLGRTVFFNALKDQDMPLSLVKKILTDQKAMNAFIFLSEKKSKLKIITFQLRSNITIAKINQQQLNLLMPSREQAKEIDKNKALPSPWQNKMHNWSHDEKLHENHLPVIVKKTAEPKAPAEKDHPPRKQKSVTKFLKIDKQYLFKPAENKKSKERIQQNINPSKAPFRL